MSNTYREIDSTLYPMMPDIHDIKKGSGYYLFSEEQMKGYLCINPRPVHADGYLLFPYALIVFDDTNRHIFSAVIEQTDYRMLSALTRTPLKELTGGHRRPTSPLSLPCTVQPADMRSFRWCRSPTRRRRRSISCLRWFLMFLIP